MAEGVPVDARKIVLDLLVERDPESWARLRGMLAILELPRLNGFESRPRWVEIELRDDEWQIITAVSFAVDEIVFHRDLAQSWAFPLDPRVFRGIPRWRQGERRMPKPTVENHD